MNERMHESLSALMDDQANELEIERLLAHTTKDASLREAWARYNLSRHALHGHHLSHLSLDISARVQAALNGAEALQSDAAAATVKQRMLRSLLSFAVAASVAVTVVIGGRQLALVGGPDADAYAADRSLATSSSPVGMLNSLGATAVQASYGMRPIPVLQPATRSAYQDLAQRRLRMYMQEHAEQAALNSPQGLVPFARVPQIRE